MIPSAFPPCHVTQKGIYLFVLYLLEVPHHLLTTYAGPGTQKAWDVVGSGCAVHSLKICFIARFKVPPAHTCSP
jgi:hypothetical protein